MRFRELRIEASKLISDHGVVAPGLMFRCTTHHLREIFTSLLPRDYVLDGSSVVQITCGPGGGVLPYRVALGSSEYFVEDFDFKTYAKASPAERERTVLSTVETALCDIARRFGSDEAALRRAVAAVAECSFSLSQEAPKLRKTLRSSRRKLRVFRCLSAELGETWVFRVTNRDGTAVAEKVMGKKPDYLDRRDYFKTAELIDSCYVVRDRLGGETFRFDVAELGG